MGREAVRMGEVEMGQVGRGRWGAVEKEVETEVLGTCVIRKSSATSGPTATACTAKTHGMPSSHLRCAGGGTNAGRQKAAYAPDASFSSCDEESGGRHVPCGSTAPGAIVVRVQTAHLPYEEGRCAARHAHIGKAVRAAHSEPISIAESRSSPPSTHTGEQTAFASSAQSSPMVTRSA